MAIAAIDGRIVEANDALCRLLGYTHDELAQLSFQEITHPDDLAADLRQGRQLLAGEIESYQVEKRYVRKDGERVWVLLTVSLGRDVTGAPVHFVGQVQDITPQKTAESVLRAAQNHLGLILEAQHAIATAGLDLERVLLLATDWAQRLTRADAAVIEMVSGDELVYRAGSGGAALHVGMRLPIDESLGGESVRSRATLRSDDSERDPRVNAEAARAVGARSMVVTPLVHRDTAVGALKVWSGTPRSFGAGDVSTLELLAGVVAASLHTIAEFEAKQALIADRTRALEALALSEARFRAAVSGAGDGFMVLHAVETNALGEVEDFAIVEMNANAYTLLGVSREEAESPSRLSEVPSALRRILAQIGRDVHTSGMRYNGEHRVGERDGAPRWVRVQAFPLDGAVERLFAERLFAVVVRDISARKNVETQLRDEASRDALTGLLNRRGLERVVAPMLADAAGRGRPDVLLCLDLDSFKPINDTYGHAEGDRVLRDVARVLLQNVRTGDAVARVGGDEFVIYAPAGASAVAGQDAVVLAQRIRTALARESERLRAEGRPYDLRASVGAVTVAPGDALEMLLTRGDRALYDEKRARRSAA
jgi:diguanylate cyclase (GGDEF)-like protein/PAS domain S-box-containing protein